MAFFTAPALRWTYLTKIGLAAMLVLLADVLFWDAGPGSALGAFALAWILATGVAQRAILKSRAALIALGLAIIMATVLAVEPSILGWVLFWSALSMAALLPRSARFGDTWLWFRRLIFHGLSALVGPIADRLRVSRVQKRTGKPHVTRHLPMLVLPLLGGGVFLALFAMANPLISDWISRLQGPELSGNSMVRLLFAAFVLITVWGSLRPHRLRYGFKPLEQNAAIAIPGVSVGSVILSLITFNALFALQNGLDVAFLWSGAPLPGQMTLAGYAHRGAYPLILTALLAGLFVLMTTQPGSAMAKNGLVRALIVFWVGQNVFLVASSILRLVDYIGAYSLTVLRISALLWMVLVGIGLILICWRMMRGKTIGWLVNANSIAALIFLGGCSLVDLGATTAWWNVRHAREIGGPGVFLDRCYMNSLGSSALLPLIEFEQRVTSPHLRDNVARIRQEILNDVRVQQSNWQSWTWRDSRRLAQLPKGLREIKLPDDRSLGCDGSLYNPSTTDAAADLPSEISTDVSAPAAQASPPLTAEPKP
jgi:Domain of unknown function (DUF4173)